MVRVNSEPIFPVKEKMKMLHHKNNGQIFFVDLTVISFTVW